MSKRILGLAILLPLLILLPGPGSALALKDGGGDPRPGSPDGPVFFVSDRSGKDSPAREYKDLQRELEGLMKEMKRLEKHLRHRFEKEVLPLMREEIKKLREWLKQFPLEKHDPEPGKTDKKRI